ncbi:MAG: hypothetical protein EA424_04430 [Planctomycetaceae bacterium]|nr:MAG: hypothetical protein EA424_04430 [Planctomycetaceae bacterium]
MRPRPHQHQRPRKLFYVSLNLPAQRSQWDDGVSQFVECYDTIKAVSPQTIVYAVFQLERMRGLGARAGWKHAPPTGT